MGADAPNEVEETIDQSDKFLANNSESDWEDLNETQQKQVLEWKDTLDEFKDSRQDSTGHLTRGGMPTTDRTKY